MSTERNAATIVIVVSDNGEDKPCTVTVTGPDGQWSAALSPHNAGNFVGSIVERVSGDLGRILCTPKARWRWEPTR